MKYIQIYKNIIVRNLFMYMKKNEIENKDKRKIYQIVNDTYWAAENQRQCFIRYFGLKPEQFKRERIIDIAKLTNRRESSIRESINIMITAKLCRVYKDYFFILDRIYKKYQRDEHLKIYKEYKKEVEKYRNSSESKIEKNILGGISKYGNFLIPIKIRKKLNIVQGTTFNLFIKDEKLILELIKEHNDVYKNLTKVQKNGHILIPKKIREELKFNQEWQPVSIKLRINKLILEKF